MDKKIYFTYDEQIDELKKIYNIKISQDRILEKDILKTFSHSLIDEYVECFSSEQLVQMGLMEFLIINTIDKQFQKILFLHSVYVENILKNKISNFIVKNKGYCIDNYIKKSRYKYSQKKIEKINKILEKLKEIIDTNENFKFYELFKNMLSIVRKFRNMVAHNKKIIGTYLKDMDLNLIKLMKMDKFNILNFKNIKENNKKRKVDIFVMIISFLFLTPSDYIVMLLFADLMIFFTNNNSVIQWVLFYLKSLNFPDDFIDKISNIFNNHLEKTRKAPFTNLL